MAHATGDLVQLKDRAAREILGGHWKDALKLLLEARAVAPHDTHVALKIGDMYQRLGKKTEAIAAYKSVATLFAAAGFLIKAISVLKIILSLDPSDREVQGSLAALYSNQQPDFYPGATPAAAEQAPSVEEEVEIDLARIDRSQLPKIPLFSDLAKDEMEQVIDKLVPVFVAAGTVVCVDGEPAESMFVISHGLVRVTGRDGAGNPVWLTNLSAGEFFGEFGLLGDGKRHAEVVAVEDTELLEIGRTQIGEIVRTHPRVQEVLFGFYKERVIDTLLAKSPLFRCLAPPERKELVELAALDKREAGSTILEEGQNGDHLYLIKSGEVEVFTGFKDRQIDLAVLRPGDIFGEISLLTGLPATATVRAREATELIRFTREVVVAVAQRHAQLRQQLAETKEHRIHETVQRIQTEGFV